MLRRIAVRGHDDGQPLAQEIVGNLVDLAKPCVVKPALSPAATMAASSGFSMPVSKAALRKASCRTSSRLAGCRHPGIVESDDPLGQRAGLVGAEYVHAAEVLDRVQAADDDALPGHRAGAGGQRHADDGGQQLRRQADRERDRKQQRLDHRPAEKLVHRQHEQNDDDHHPDQEVAELPDAAPELGLGRAGFSRATIAPKAVRRPVSTASTFAVPLWTEAPRKTALVRAGKRPLPAERSPAASRPGRIRRSGWLR